MNVTGSGRKHPFALLFLLLLLIAGIELFNTLKQSIGSGIGDAVHAGLLVFSLFGFLSLLAGMLWPGGKARQVVLVALYLALAPFGVVLFLSWLAFWITGRPVNLDAMSILVESPVPAILHLLSSAPPLLLGIFIALAAFLYGLSWLFRYSLRAAPLVPLSTRVLLCVLLAPFAGFAAVRIASTENSRSSYAGFLNRRHDAIADVLVYSCPRSPDVPLTTPVSGGHTNGVPVIVLMIESLRADLATTFATAMPNIVHLAGESMFFEKAYATSSHSDYADLAFWYSRYPLRGEQRLGYPPDAPWRGLSVFEYFKLYGYSTAYFSSQNEKWGQMINWLKIPAIDTYFDSENFEGPTWENPDDAQGLIALIRAGSARAGKVEDSDTLRLAAEWIEKHASEPFFIGLNLQNTHYHYYIPKGGSRPFQPDELGFRAVYSAWPPEQAATVRNRYLNAAYNVDAAVHQFAERLKRAGVWDKAVVLILGDSGEAFYEHGFGNHSGPMYEEVARTLAFLKLPKGDPRNGTKWTEPVSHLDFVPALADIAGMNEWAGFQGKSPWQQPPGSPVYMTVNALAIENSVLRWPWKLMMRRFPARGVELYNLENDPGEKRNEVQQQPALALEMLRDLDSWRACQLGYYADRAAHTRLQPPRYSLPHAPTTGNASTPAAQ